MCMYVYVCVVDEEGTSTATAGTDGHSQADLIINTVGSSEARGESDRSQRKGDSGACLGYG